MYLSLVCMREDAIYVAMSRPHSMAGWILHVELMEIKCGGTGWDWKTSIGRYQVMMLHSVPVEPG